MEKPVLPPVGPGSPTPPAFPSTQARPPARPASSRLPEPPLPGPQERFSRVSAKAPSKTAEVHFAKGISDRPEPRVAHGSGPRGWLQRISLRSKIFLMLLALFSGTVFGPFGTQSAGASEVSVQYEWYRYQGESDSGAEALYNCEVTTTAMAIQLVRGGLRIAVKDVRSVIGHNGPTVTADAKKALRYWGVQTNDIDNMDQVLDSVRRGHVVIAGLMMGAISTGADLGQARSSPKNRTGRYSAYSSAHSIVIRGVSADGQWLTVYDPNNWDGNPVYMYSDGTPKGKDRLYKTSEVAAGMRELVDFPRALEILGTNAPAPNGMPAASPTATPNPNAASAPVGKPAPRQSGDLTALVSGGGGWSSAVLSFAVKNFGDGGVYFDAIGVRGTKPDGKPFEVMQKAVTLGAGQERTISLLAETPDNGEWQVKSIVYQTGSQWTELTADGKLNKATFRIGNGVGIAPKPAGTSEVGKKPGLTNLPGSD